MGEVVDSRGGVEGVYGADLLSETRHCEVLFCGVSVLYCVEDGVEVCVDEGVLFCDIAWAAVVSCGVH